MTAADLEIRLQRTLPQARLDVDVLPDCDGIRLAPISRDFPLGPLDPDVMRSVIAAPAYWPFCWGSGLALARYLLRTPERVRCRSVLDLGPGSGIAGIAAARASADRVIACDIDPDARLATRVNADLNETTIDVIESIRARSLRGRRRQSEASANSSPIFRSFEEHSGLYVTNTTGKSGHRCAAAA